MYVTRQYRAYSFGEPIDSCHFGLVYPSGTARLRRAPRLDGHDDEQSIITIKSIIL